MSPSKNQRNRERFQKHKGRPVESDREKLIQIMKAKYNKEKESLNKQIRDLKTEKDIYLKQIGMLTERVDELLTGLAFYVRPVSCTPNFRACFMGVCFCGQIHPALGVIGHDSLHYG